MTSPVAPPEPGGALTNDPVRWTWVIYGFVQAVVTVLLAADVLSTSQAAIITGVALALYVAASELYTRPETVPRVPLEQLAYVAEEPVKEGDIPTGVDPPPME